LSITTTIGALKALPLVCALEPVCGAEPVVPHAAMAASPGASDGGAASAAVLVMSIAVQQAIASSRTGIRARTERERSRTTLSLERGPPSQQPNSDEKLKAESARRGHASGAHAGFLGGRGVRATARLRNDAKRGAKCHMADTKSL
jgi:hypothetical protein